MKAPNKPSAKPLTIRQIQARKKAMREAEQKKIRIKNVSPHQLVTIQLYGKRSKKSMEQLSISLPPGKSVELPESRIIPQQIANLKKRGTIRTNKVGLKKKRSPEPVNTEEVKANITKNASIKRPKKTKASKKTKDSKTQDEQTKDEG